MSSLPEPPRRDPDPTPPGIPAMTPPVTDETVDAVRDAGADGVHLDVEVFDAVPAEVRAAYVQFVRDLQTALGPDAVVSVFALALDDADVYDEARLAAAADYLVVQGYDYHWKGGAVAGPVAPLEGWGRLNWSNVLARYDSLGVDRTKLVMAAPLYGYEWPTKTALPGSETRGPGQTIGYADVTTRVPEVQVSAQRRVAQHGLQRDFDSGSAFYTYKDASGWHQGWFEDEEAMRAKFAWIKEQGLGGVALFPLGYDGGLLDDLVQEAFPAATRRKAVAVAAR